MKDNAKTSANNNPNKLRDDITKFRRALQTKLGDYSECVLRAARTYATTIGGDNKSEGSVNFYQKGRFIINFGHLSRDYYLGYYTPIQVAQVFTLNPEVGGYQLLTNGVDNTIDFWVSCDWDSVEAELNALNILRDILKIALTEAVL